MGFSLKVNLDAIDRQIEGQKKAIKAAARPAAKAMADVYYEAVKSNVAALESRPGRKGFYSGDETLHDAIYRVHSDSRSRDGKQIYEISWNKRKAPHGHLVEFGYIQRYTVVYDDTTGRFFTHVDKPLKEPKVISANPFFRPALDQAQRAKEAGVARFKEVVREKSEYWRQIRREKR